ncbi:HIT family protein [Caldimonas brevitalea]
MARHTEEENARDRAAALHPACELCRSPGGMLVLQRPHWRLVRVEDQDFPAYYRVIWNAHCAELTDLTPEQRHECLDAVAEVEAVLRRHLRPTKINLAAFGNMVPHLHWHIIARHVWDSHFPQPVWGPRQREVPEGARARLAATPATLDQAMREAFGPTSEAK